jgi:hypothetical protein
MGGLEILELSHDPHPKQVLLDKLCCAVQWTLSSESLGRESLSLQSRCCFARHHVIFELLADCFFSEGRCRLRSGFGNLNMDAAHHIAPFLSYRAGMHEVLEANVFDLALVNQP